MRFDAARQDSMLAHELAHLAAHDTCWCLLADAATAVLWWHPGVWWLRRQMHLASEMAADEASLLVADGPRVLAECLVELGTRLAAPACWANCASRVSVPTWGGACSGWCLWKATPGRRCRAGVPR